MEKIQWIEEQNQISSEISQTVLWVKEAQEILQNSDFSEEFQKELLRENRTF